MPARRCRPPRSRRSPERRREAVAGAAHGRADAAACCRPRVARRRRWRWRAGSRRARGARLWRRRSNARVERGAGRVPVDRIPYAVDSALSVLADSGT